MSNVVSMDDYKYLEDIVRERLGVKEVIIIGIDEDFQTSYVGLDISDIDLVYAIQYLKDLRARRVDDANS